MKIAKFKVKREKCGPRAPIKVSFRFERRDRPISAEDGKLFRSIGQCLISLGDAIESGVSGEEIQKAFDAALAAIEPQPKGAKEGRARR